MKTYKRALLVLGITSLAFVTLFITMTGAQHGKSAAGIKTGPLTKAETKARAAANAKWRALRRSPQAEQIQPQYSTAVSVIETPAVRDLKPETFNAGEKNSRVRKAEAGISKNPRNTSRVKPDADPSMTGPFIDPTLRSAPSSKGSVMHINAVTNPIVNFDGPDMDAGEPLFGGRLAPPDTNADVGPNHVVVTTNGGMRIYTKAGVPLTAQFRISALLAGVPNAADDDGDPIVLYDWAADRWLISQFNTRFVNNQMHQHIAISKTGDPTGAYYAYDFALPAGRFVDYPHFGVWPSGYFMSANDFNPALTAFLGASLYSFERAKMLAGDPTAKMIFFQLSALHGGFLPTNLQGYTPPPAGTPNMFIEFDATEFGAATDLIRPYAFTPDYAVPGNSTLVQHADVVTAPFDARSNRVQQPAPGENLDAIADRLMHAMNFRVLPGGVQSYVLNFTVNVSGLDGSASALNFQGGVRWMELRRNSGTGAITINQEATYAPGAGVPAGRDLWMASVAQDGEGNIGLAASASNVTALLNPTAIYTGRLAGDPVTTLPQGEVDAMSAVTRGVQTSTFNRWGDYSSLFVDPSDDCTFWGAFEYVDSPTATFDWNTRVFSFKVNPTCVTPARGTLQFNVTTCETGLPLEGALITLNGNPHGATEADGQFSGTVVPGNYAYTISKANYDQVGGNTVVTNGNTTIVNVCLVGHPDLDAAGSTLVNEACPPTNGAVDPGETVTLDLKLTNVGGASTTNLVATLLPSASVIGPSGPMNYGAIAPGATVGRNFTFTASALCGSNITLTLQLQDGAENLGTVNYTVGTGGGAGAPVVTNYPGAPVVIPDGVAAGVNIPITVSGFTAAIGDLNFRIDGSACNALTTAAADTNGVRHTWVGDLTFKLTSPSGTTVTMIDRIGVPASQFGNGGNNFCQVVLDDQGGFPAIENFVGQPVTGNFTPNNPLSAFNGENPNGVWTLNVSDAATPDGGNVRNFSLVISPKVCNGACLGSPAINTTTTWSCDGLNKVATITVKNTGTGTANNVNLTVAKLAGINGTPLPQSVGSLAPGASSVKIVTFSGAPSGLQTLQVGGTYDGGTFNMNKKVVTPNCNAAFLRTTPYSPLMPALLASVVPAILTGR